MTGKPVDELSGFVQCHFVIFVPFMTIATTSSYSRCHFVMQMNKMEKANVTLFKFS